MNAHEIRARTRAAAGRAGCLRRGAALLAAALCAAGCKGEVLGLPFPSTPGATAASGHGGGRGDNFFTADPEVAATAAGVRFRCTEPALRGTGQTAMRRLTRDEYMQSAEAIFGTSIVSSPDVAQAAEQIPAETTGDIVSEFQNGHAFDHVQGVLLTSEALATAVAADAATRDRFFGSCAAKADAACASAFLDGGGRRVLRRPLEGARRQALLDAFQAAGAGLTGLQAVLARLLQAPEAIFHLELPRQDCVNGSVAAQTAAFAWDDASAFFVPDGASKSAPPEVIGTNGWYVWQLPGAKIAGAYTRLSVDLSVTAPADGPLQLDVNLNDQPLLQGITLADGAQKITADVSVAQGTDTKLGVNIRNAGSGRSVEMRTLQLSTTASKASQCTDVPFEDGKMYVDDWAVASRVAYALTGRGPDDQLLDAAARGELRTEAQVRPHAERLIASPDARRQLEAILDAWLNLKAVPTPTETIANAAGIDPVGVAAEARRELLDYALFLVLDRDADAETLMTAKIGFPRTARMAKLYGSAVATGDKPVDLTKGHGGMLLRIAPLLSGQHRSSPILRGVYVRKRLLCDDLPSPDFSVVQARTEALADADPAKLSSREISEQITSPPTCMTCHAKINPIGFTLEQFGPLGLPRTVEIAYTLDGVEVAQHPIDASSDDPELEEGGPAHLNGAQDLVHALGEGGKLRACIAQRLYTHAQLRPVAPADSCALADVELALRQGKSMKEAWLLSVVNTELFLRKAPEATP